MASLSLTCKPWTNTFSLYGRKTPAFSLCRQAERLDLAPRAQASSSLRFIPLSLRFSFGNEGILRRAMKTKKNGGRGSGAVCYAAPLSVRHLQWISTFSSAILMIARGTPIQKSFLVLLFAIQAPASVIAWIKLVCVTGVNMVFGQHSYLFLFASFFIPGELELPFLALLLVIVAPYQITNLRGTQEGAIISLVLAGFLAFQHFSRTGSLQRAFDQGAIVATLAIICITAVSFLLLV